MGTKISDFKKLKSDVETCTKCPLSKTRTNAVPGSGNVKSNVVLIGEAPGKDEDIQGIPFVGRSGKILTRTLITNKISRGIMRILPQRISLKLTKMILKKGIDKGSW